MVNQRSEHKIDNGDDTQNGDQLKSQSSGKKGSQQIIDITEDDLPLSCPLPGTTLWSQHPRVFIPIENGEGHCPYCGNCFQLKS